MKILVLGSGVIGTTSAWYLAQSGHEVTVVDRQKAPAQETSFANAGQLSYGYTSPWAAPGLIPKALKWMIRKDAPLIIKPQMSWTMMAWLFAMARQCNETNYKKNKSIMMRLSRYSAGCLAQLRAQTGIDYEGRQLGTIQLFRSQKQFAALAKDIDVLRADGIAFDILDEAGCLAVEPGLSGIMGKIVGGLRTPDDETGDCALFTRRLARSAQELGVKFLFNTPIHHLMKEDNKIVGAMTAKGKLTADATVVALGSFSPLLLKQQDIHLPVYPVKGYSITVDIQNEARAPHSTVIDDFYKVAITRLGRKIRIGGMAEISGYRLRYPPARKRVLETALHMLFSGAGSSEGAVLWSGLRPSTPSSVPIIGATSQSQLYVNTGHGTLGWTMAAGSGKLLADIINNTAPDIDAHDLSPLRYK